MTLKSFIASLIYTIIFLSVYMIESTKSMIGWSRLW